MVAASAAEGRDDNTLLIVDRSFKCLEAVAENMLGGWVGVAMRVFLRGEAIITPTAQLPGVHCFTPHSFHGQ